MVRVKSKDATVLGLGQAQFMRLEVEPQQAAPGVDLAHVRQQAEGAGIA